MKQQLSVGQTLEQAFSHLHAGRSAEARRYARTLESCRPEPPGLAYLQGLLALSEGQGRKAAQHLSRALTQTPGAVPPLLAMARAQTQQDRHHEAEGAYRLLLSFAPDLSAAWREVSELFFTTRRFAAARVPLSHAALLAPDNATLRNNLGIACRAAGDPTGAEIQFRMAIIFEPGNGKAYANLAGLRRHRKITARHVAQQAVRVDPGDGAHWVELGQAHVEDQDLAAALACFRQAAEILPEQIEPRWLLASALRQLDRNDEATALYHEILALDPDDRFGAALALAQLGKTALPAHATAAHIASLYDQYAASFDRDLVEGLAYRGPQVIAQAIERVGVKGPCDIIDIGCGTGLAGLALQPMARRLDGVDLSAKMADQARARGIYDQVIVADVLTAMAERPLHYDLVVAADVLIYQGDLHPIAKAAFDSLRPGGSFAFTVECSEAAPFQLRSTGRFAHSPEHLRQVAADQGFVLALLEPTETRREQGMPVASLLCLMQKP